MSGLPFQRKRPRDQSSESFRPTSTSSFPRSNNHNNNSNNNNVKDNNNSTIRDVVVILEKAGLILGRDGLVDAYDRAASTEIANESLKEVRPDIVHQCLLAIFDTDLAFRRKVKVYISTIKGKTIEISPTLRPPRTYGRFKGLMSALLRDGFVTAADGQKLMRVLPGTVAPIVPHNAEVIGLCNSSNAPVRTPTELAKQAKESPVSNDLQGGIKNVAAFYCVSCTDDQNMDGIDYVTEKVCLNAYPASSHVLCARLCEGFGRLLGPVRRDETEEKGDATVNKVVRSTTPRPSSFQQQSMTPAAPTTAVSNATGGGAAAATSTFNTYQPNSFHRGGRGGRGGGRGGGGASSFSNASYGGRGGSGGFAPRRQFSSSNNQSSNNSGNRY